MQSLTDNFVRVIERKILTGEWPSGYKIPPLRSLADEYNVSRSVVNAGIAELQNKGYLDTVPRKYNIVTDWKKRGTLAVLNGIIGNELYDGEFLSNMLETRMLIECEAVRLAAVRRNDSDLREIYAVIEDEKLAVTVDQRACSDVNFHHTIVGASHNIVYPLLLKSFEEMVLRFVTVFYQNNGDRKFVYDRHKIIYDAILNKDADKAADAMRGLLEQGADILREYMK